MSSDESLYREVDEDVRREQLAQIWKRYGNAIIAVALGVIVAVAGIKGWQYWQLKQSETAARAYAAAVELDASGKSADAAKAFADLTKGQPGFAALAGLREAASLAASGDTKGAVAAYDKLAASPDKVIADVARVRAAWLLVDTASLADLQGRLAGLDAPDNAFRSAAREIIGLAQYKAGDLEKANKSLTDLLNDPEAPPSARARANVILKLIAPRLGAKQAG